MTEQEAIKEIKHWTNILMSAGSKCVLETAEAQKMAIDALKEIQKYKNIGVSSADELEQDLLLHKADSVVLNQYKAIGTVDECREAKEKQRVKQAILYGDCEDGKLICPSCNKDLWDLRECGFDFCPYCSQAIKFGGI